MNTSTSPISNHVPPITLRQAHTREQPGAGDAALEAQTDLEHLITTTAAIAATHHDWRRLRQLFLTTFATERMTVEFPELVTEWTLSR